MATVNTVGLADHGRLISDDEFAEADFEPGYKYELIDGRLYVSYEPDPKEVYLNDWLLDKLKAYARRRPEVINYVAGRSRVIVSNRSGTTNPQPDVAAFRDYPHNQLGGESWRDLSPVLVAEVLIDSDPYKDLVRNVDIYLNVPSIREYWILNGHDDPHEPTLIVYRRRGSRWLKKQEFSFGSTYRTPLLPGFALLIDPHR